jgi:hypothetical protein
MIDISRAHPFQCVTTFEDLVSMPYDGAMNAICWTRELAGDFGEIVSKISLDDNITVLEPAELLSLDLTAKGQLARQILLYDLELLTTHGASPTLNLIKYYDRDDAYPFFSTDVYSWHVDRSPIPTHTFLCIYHGDASEILPNAQAEQKIGIPEIRNELKKLYSGTEAGFESFLNENFFDLHYRAKDTAQPICLGLGNVWRLAVDHPESNALPCIHRAPKEKNGQIRLLMIC